MKAVLVRIGYVSAAVLAVFYLISTATGPKGVKALMDKQRRIQAMAQRNAEIARDIEERKQRIGKLRGDRDEQEKVIEERFKYVRPGDKIFMLPGSGAGNQPSPGGQSPGAGESGAAPKTR
jgi:cell division protein FtsB